jgi:hypothetical protein
MKFFGPVFERIMKGERTYSKFMQGGPAARALHCSINVLYETFEGKLISHRLWHAWSPDLNSCDFYLGKCKKESVLK